MLWRFGPYMLDMNNACLWRDEHRLTVRPKTFDILVHLVEHAGELVTRDELLEAVWPETVVADGVLATSIGELRKILGETAREPQYIDTVHRRGYRFIAPISQSTGPLASSSNALMPSSPLRLVGRETELEWLGRAYTQALAGSRQLVFVTGEAGIGKTTLVDAFIEHVSLDKSVWIGRGQCIDQYGVGEAYLPLLEALTQIGGQPGGARLVELLSQQAPSWLLHMPAFLSNDHLATLQKRPNGATQERMLRELAEAIEHLTADYPLILVVEDLHWSDLSSLDWLSYIARRRQPARLLVLGTYRPTDAIAHGHPVHKVTQELCLRGYSTELILEYFPEEAVTAYLRQRFGEAERPCGLVRNLHQRSHGNPLFLETIVDALVRQEVIREEAGAWVWGGHPEEIASGVPDSLRQLIEQQFAKLSPDDQSLLEAASIVGKDFDAATVAAVLEDTEEGIESRCEALIRQGQFLREHVPTAWPDGTISGRYGFSHDLYRETIYTGLPSVRRVRGHQKIGLRLEAAYRSRAPEIAAELAEHFMSGRDLQRATHYLRLAGENAIRRSANQEATGHLTKGLEILQTLPETPNRTQQDLTLNVNLAVALVAINGQGSAEVERVFTRARELCQQVGETPQLLPVLWGIFRFYFARAQFKITHDLAEQIMRLATQTQDPALLLEAHRGLGVTLFCLGHLPTARAHLEKGILLYSPAEHQSHAFMYGQDPGVTCRAYLSWTLWQLGYPDQALEQSQAALRDAQALGHPHTLALALVSIAVIHQHRRERAPTRTHAESISTLSMDQNIAFFEALGAILGGWAQGIEGETDVGISRIQQAVAHNHAIGIKMFRSYHLGLLADIYMQAKQPTAGLEAVADALSLMSQTGERFNESEHYRLRGELLLHQSLDHQSEAESCFHQALTVAQTQQAKSLELRATTSLAQLWQRQGKHDEARQILGTCYEWFTEGFDTADLKAAYKTLDGLTEKS